MKSRNREINIFNMSLLDILCGALGAFCFMMIVLLPYYKPDNPEDQKKQKEMEETMKKLEELKKEMPDSKMAKELEDLIKKLQEQIKELEGRVNKLSQENKELADKNQELDKKNKELSNELQQTKEQNQKLQKDNNRLSMRMPGAIAMYCNGPLPSDKYAILDICLWSPNTNVGGKGQPLFDPNILINPKFFDGERNVPLGGPVPMTVYMYRDIIGGIKQKIYVKLWPGEIRNDKPVILPLRDSMKVNGQILSGTPDTNIDLPEVELTPQHPWMLLGSLDSDDNGILKFIVATQAEREQEWRTLDKPQAATP